MTSGPGALSGTTSYNIGSSGSNGVVSFTDLTINAVSNNFVLTATARRCRRRRLRRPAWPCGWMCERRLIGEHQQHRRRHQLDGPERQRY